MAYKKLISNNLRNAFKQLKDLAEDVVFIGKAEKGFNFTSKQSNDTLANGVTIKAVVIKDEKKTKGSSTRLRQLMFQTADVEDIKTYDTIRIGRTDWLVGDDVFSDKYITLLEIHKKGETE